MQLNLPVVNNKEEALYQWALLFSVALLFSIAACSFSIAFSIMLFSQASLVLLYTYLQCVHSAATIAKVGPLATGSGLPIMCAARVWFYCVVSGAFSFWLVWDCIPPPSTPIRYLGSWTHWLL